MILDYAPLSRAIGQLASGLAMATAAPDNDLLRDGVIQRFECTYELSHKMLHRHLAAMEAGPQDVQTLSFPDLIRLGSERGLLRSDWTQWQAYRAARAATSHTYDVEKARQVFAAIPDFLEEARYLVARLQETGCER